MSYRELLESELPAFQVQLSDTQKAALVKYCDEVEKWNDKINLTALSGAGLVRRLIAEPIWIAKQLALSGCLVDIGSGNGSPGIPFHIVSPSLDTHFVEARLKRAAFLRQVVSTLKLTNVRVHRCRFEQGATSLANPDWISLQAVGLTRKLVDSIRRIAGPTTTIVWITSPSAQSILAPLKILTVPNTGTRVLLFRLDLP